MAQTKKAATSTWKPSHSNEINRVFAVHNAFSFMPMELRGKISRFAFRRWLCVCARARAKIRERSGDERWNQEMQFKLQWAPFTRARRPNSKSSLGAEKSVDFSWAELRRKKRAAKPAKILHCIEHKRDCIECVHGAKIGYTFIRIITSDFFVGRRRMRFVPCMPYTRSGLCMIFARPQM